MRKEETPLLKDEMRCTACGKVFMLKSFVCWKVKKNEHWRCHDCLPAQVEYEYRDGWRIPLGKNDMQQIWSWWNKGWMGEVEKKEKFLDLLAYTIQYGKPRSSAWAVNVVQRIYCYENGLPFDKRLSLPRDMAPAKKQLAEVIIELKGDK